MSDVIGLIWGPMTNFLGYGGEAAAANFTIDSASDSISALFYAPKDGSIDRISFGLNANVGGGRTLECLISTCDSSGLPTGTPVGAASTPTTPSGSGTIQTHTLGTPATVTRGTLYAAMVRDAGGGGAGSSSIRTTSGPTAGSSARLNMPAILSDNAGSQNISVAEQSFRLTAYYDDDEAVASVSEGTPTNTAFNSGSSPDEYGAKFTIPVSMNVRGIAVRVASANAVQDLIFTLYDSASNVLQTVTLPCRIGDTSRAYWNVLFPTDELLTLGNTYRISVKPSSTTNITFVDYDNADAKQKSSLLMFEAKNWQLTTRTDSGIWTDTNTKVPAMGLIVESLSLAPSISVSISGATATATAKALFNDAIALGPPIPDPEPDFGAPIITIYFVFEWRDHRFNFIADITPSIISADIELDNGRQITRIAKFEIDPDLLPDDFNIETCRIAVNPVVIQNGISTFYRMGLFASDVAIESYEPAGNPLDFSLDPIPPKTQITWRADGADVTMHLQESRITRPYTISANTSYITAIQTLINTVTFYDFAGELNSMRYNFPEQAVNYSEVTPYDYTYGPATSKLDIINDMLKAINWYPLWADGTGILMSKPQLLPSDEQDDVEYSTDLEPRMIVPPFEKGKLRGQYHNQVVVVIDDPRRPPAFSFRENYDSDSAISVANLDPSLEEIDGSNMLSSTVAEDLADYTLGLNSAQSMATTLQTDFDPRRKAHETYKLTIAGVEAGTKWKVFGWSLSMKTGAIMSHKIGRVEILSIRTVDE